MSVASGAPRSAKDSEGTPWSRGIPEPQHALQNDRSVGVLVRIPNGRLPSEQDEHYVCGCEVLDSVAVHLLDAALGEPWRRFTKT